MTAPAVVAPCILVIDDEPIIRETVSALLRSEGYRIERAENGFVGVEMAIEKQPDVIITDLMMPDRDGFEVCRLLTQDPRTRHIPVLMLTALDDRQTLAQAIDAGAQDFIAKPPSSIELRARVRAMARLKAQQDELRELARVREELARMVVHDMRSPLMVMMTAVGLLSESDALVGEDAEILAELGSMVTRIDQMVDDLLLVAKLEHGSLQVKSTSLPVRPIMEDAAEMHRRAGAPRQLSVDVRLPQDENLTVFADASLVRRVLENLMGNALKFSPIGGVVTLAAEAQRRGDRGGVCLSVSDQGPGIPVDQRTRVFEKFVTLPGAAAGRQTGLGLTFVRDVVLAHGGAIAVTEAEGGGARFDLWLPEPSA